MRYKFTHARPIQYINPSFVAEPGKEYDLKQAPDSQNWEKVERDTKRANEKEGK